jgi:cytochrome P450
MSGPDAALPPRPRVPAFFQAMMFYNRPVLALLRLRGRLGPCFQLREPAIWGAEWVVWVCDEDAIRSLLEPGAATARPDDDHGVAWRSGDPAADARARELVSDPGDWSAAASAAARRRVQEWPRGRPIALYEEIRSVAIEILFGTLGGVRSPERIERVERLLAKRTLRNIPIFPDFRYSSNGRRIERARRRYEALAALLEEAEPPLRLPLAGTLAHGFDAVTALCGWALERLMRHPRALAELRADVEAGSSAYLDAVLAETLRVRPLVLSVARRLVADRAVCGYELPAGTLIRLAIGIVHFPPEATTRPRDFEPERHLGTAAAPPLAFGAGPARCAGDAWGLAVARVILREIVLGVEFRRQIDPDELSRFRRPHRMLTPSNKARAVLAD